MIDDIGVDVDMLIDKNVIEHNNKSMASKMCIYQFAHEQIDMNLCHYLFVSILINIKAKIIESIRRNIKNEKKC